MSFSDNSQAIQRCIDGELRSAEAQAVQELLAVQPELAATYDALQVVDRVMGVRCDAQEFSDHGNHALVGRIMEALPQAAVRSERYVDMAGLCFALCMMGCIVSVYAYAGSSSALADILPMSFLTLLSMTIGIILMFFAQPIRRVEAHLVGRLLRRRIYTAQMDIMVYRCAGIALVCGGVYLYI